MSKRSDSSVLLENRKSRYLYFLTEFFTAGLVLTGTEIKSLRARNASLSDSYIFVKGGEAWIANMHIAPYQDGTIFNVDHLRNRKLLLSKREIRKIEDHIKGTGKTCVPTKVFLHHGYAKVEIALAEGKKAHDKRDAIKERDAKRSLSKARREGVKATGE